MKLSEVTLKEAFPAQLTPLDPQPRNGYTGFQGDDGYNYFVYNQPNDEGKYYYYRSVTRNGNRMRLKSYEVPDNQQQAVASAIQPTQQTDLSQRATAADAEAAGLPDWAAGYSNFGAALGQYAQQNDGELPPSLTTSPNSMADATRDMEAAGITVQPDSAPAPQPAPTGPVTQDPEAGDGPEPSQTPDNFTLTQTLRRGSRGDQVRRLQAALGMPANEQDGIFGPRTEQAVRRFQQSQGVQVDGIVGRQTLAAIQRTRENPNAPRNVTPGQIQNQSKENTGNALIESIERLAGVNMKKKLDEASININGADASEVAEILRMMQLAGADGAKVVGADDINSGPKPCPICGKMHGPSQPMGGCGSKPSEPGMGDMIRLMSPEESVAEENEDGGFEDATTEPDEEMTTYANDMSASIPAGNDLHKEKGSYPATAGGDNPMNTESELEETIKSALLKALQEKKKPDDDDDGVPNWADKKPGEDDNAGKKKGSKPKKGEVPPQFKK